MPHSKLRGWGVPPNDKQGHYFAQTDSGALRSLCNRFEAAQGATFYDSKIVMKDDCLDCGGTLLAILEARAGARKRRKAKA